MCHFLYCGDFYILNGCSPCYKIHRNKKFLNHYYFVIFSYLYRGSSKIPSVPFTTQQHNGSNGSLLTNANLQQQEQQQTPTKQSMLGKLKLFGKDKSTECPKTQLSKRTSSSSGFSSARSERSDSSLSLNNESTNIPTSQSSSSNKSISTKKSDSSKTSTKASKFSATPASAATTGKSSKGDKRDKSQLNNQAAESNGTNVAGAANTDISPTKMHKIPQAKLQVPVGRKSESKTGLSSQQQQAKASTQSTSVSTSIPKPMAAIKGTSKTTQQQIESDDNNSNSMKCNGDDVIKVEKVSISVQNNNNNDIVQKTQIVNPLGLSPLHNNNHQLLNQTNNNNNNNTNNGSNISNNNNTMAIQPSTVLMTDSLLITSTNNQSNSSDSSVIYRTASAATTTLNDTTATSIHADIYQMQSHTNPISNRKLENFNDPLLINGNKFGMLPTKVNGVVQTTIFEDDKEATTASPMVPMRSLMRGFNNHMSSPSRMSSSRTLNGYYDENGQGYCSDGDAFRKSSIRYSDIENGYLSEGPHFLSILRNRPQLPSTIAEER